MTIQPPSPGRTGVRATRLATAMTTHGGDRALSAAGLPEQKNDRRLVAD
ncbi:MAG: hypothetical protein ACRDRY_20695 [Pseudonocardiaceae bacterium]